MLKTEEEQIAEQKTDEAMEKLAAERQKRLEATTSTSNRSSMKDLIETTKSKVKGATKKASSIIGA